MDPRGRPPPHHRLRQRHASSTSPSTTDRFHDRMLDAVRGRAPAAPAHRGRAGACTPPAWVDDDVDLDRHVRRVGSTRPATSGSCSTWPRRSRRSRSPATARCGSSPSSTASPTAAGAMVQKIHHTITDGQGGVRMSAQFIDLERDPTPRPRPERVERAVGLRRRPALRPSRACWRRCPAWPGARSPSPARPSSGATDVVTHPDRLVALPSTPPPPPGRSPASWGSPAAACPRSGASAPSGGPSSCSGSPSTS